LDFDEEKLNTPPKLESLGEVSVDPSGFIDTSASSAANAPLRRKPAATEGRARTISLLSISPVAADHHELQQALHPGQWTVCKAQTLSAALAILMKRRFPVVVCESDLGQDSWREMLAQIALVGSSPPSFIVTSRLADERLWVEALNVGAYDVLVKPFHVTELKRVLESAWSEWRDRDQSSTSRILVKAAGA
jgi:DNA-binding NtrC family response regulator